MAKTKNLTFKRSIFVVTMSVLFIAVAVYAATTISNNIVTGGTLNVTGLSTFSTATSTSATSTAYLYIGPDFDEGSLFNFAGGDLAVAGDVSIGGVASTTGDLYVSGGTLDVTTTTATTTIGLFSRGSGTATSTISIGDIDSGDADAGCLEMVREGAYFHCFINAAGTGMECKSGRCN